MAVNQCARFLIDPRITHERVVMRIRKCIHGTKNRSIKITSDRSRGIECIDNSNFTGIWVQADEGNPESVYKGGNSSCESNQGIELCS